MAPTVCIDCISGKLVAGSMKFLGVYSQICTTQLAQAINMTYTGIDLLYELYNSTNNFDIISTTSEHVTYTTIDSVSTIL